MKNLTARKPNRLKDHDYCQNGAYFITICTKDRRKWLGEVVGAAIGRPPKIQLSHYGEATNQSIQKIYEIYRDVKIDKYVIMPNHIHMILLIDRGRAMRAPTIGTVINQLKGYVSKQIGFSIWQKLFYDHIIRNEAEYQKIWQYIDTNPLKWELDFYYIK